MVRAFLKQRPLAQPGTWRWRAAATPPGRAGPAALLPAVAPARLPGTWSLQQSFRTPGHGVGRDKVILSPLALIRLGGLQVFDQATGGEHVCQEWGQRVHTYGDLAGQV